MQVTGRTSTFADLPENRASELPRNSIEHVRRWETFHEEHKLIEARLSNVHVEFSTQAIGPQNRLPRVEQAEELRRVGMDVQWLSPPVNYRTRTSYICLPRQIKLLHF